MIDVTLRKHEKDTGSAQVQIMALTHEIVKLTAHCAQHDKDFSSRRSILKKVAQRKRFLNYLKKNDFDAFTKVTTALQSASNK